LCIQAVGKAAMDMVQEVRRQFREIPGIMEYKAKPEYEKCVAISTKASIREMMLPGAIALITPVLVGFIFGPEVLGGLLAGVTVSGVLMGIFQSNAGGAWDNAKKSFEKGVSINGEMFYKKSEPHKASVTGDTVGDPFKDTSGPSMNILIKLMSIVSLVIAPYIVGIGSSASQKQAGVVTQEVKKCVVDGVEVNCDSLEKAATKDINVLEGMYEVDVAHSAVDFSIKHIITNTKGSISIDSGWVNLQNPGTKVYIQLDTKSINTQNSGRDEHLMGSDFFDAAKYPAITFEGTEVSLDSLNKEFRYAATGKLTMHGVTKDAVINFNFVDLQEKEGRSGKVQIAGFEGKTIVNRVDYGVGSAGGLSEKVVILFDLEAGRPVAK
jgi:K(+)-stimulated pyrophosphate-energized sodium pump